MVFVNIRSACLYAGSEVSGGGDERRDLSARNLGGRREGGGGFGNIDSVGYDKKNSGVFVQQYTIEKAHMSANSEKRYFSKKTISTYQS